MTIKANPRRRRRRVRRNPRVFGISTRGLPRIVGTVIQAGQDAALIVGGKAAASFGARMIPIGEGTWQRFAANVISAAGVAVLAGMMLSRENARIVTAGALVAPIESAIRGANIPIISAALGDDVLMPYTGPSGVGAYPQAPALVAGAAGGGVGAYPQEIAGEWEGYGASGGF